MSVLVEGEVDLREIEANWNARWASERAHEARPREGRPKFFATYPYSYMNAFAHIGHAYTMTRVDFLVRYRRMLGENVLYPFAYHVTGTPIVAAANRVREGEPKQIQILEQQGIPADLVPKFADPWYWVDYFPKEWRQDVSRLGLHVDWRREFHTTEKNPHYDAFIQWQFRKLREGGYVDRGRHPIMWCPKDSQPVADHDRYEGEGETPQEWTLYKMALDTPAAIGLDGPAYLIAATLRPDTVFGQTNVWVDPAHGYSPVKVGEETWLLNEKSVADLRFQFPEMETGERSPIPGALLVGQRVRAPATGALVPVLPAAFIRHEKGTGIVTSVPSDSPQDLLSLRAVQDGTMDAPDAVREMARAIQVIPVIRTEKYGTDSAAKAIAEAGARDHRDAAGIANATEKAYQAGFYEGVMLENAGEFAGKPVAEVKDGIRDWLVARGEAVVGYWPSGAVVCRCLTPCVVKIVSDQWFMKYGDAAWKAKAQKALDAMHLYPEVSRKQFNHVVGWLRAWACAREGGLGTKLPWDGKWIIESLSDSTIYMAYYTIAHLIERGTVTGTEPRAGVDAKDLTDAFFDYVLLGKGTPESAAKGTVTADVAKTARAEFQYWYPLDFRNSGKDLVQNHLTFMIFNHVAIWDEPRYWPRGIGVNGWVTVDGEKMSKSRGNFITLRQALSDYGVSGTRLALAYAGEGLDDANFDREFARSGQRRMQQWVEFAREAAAGKVPTRAERLPVDAWFESTMHRLVGETKAAMDEAMFRTALKIGYFDLQREWQWYLKRSSGRPHKDVLAAFVDTQTRLITPIVPHVAEEVRRALGREGLAIDAPYPTADPAMMSAESEEAERYVKSVLDDVREILKVTGKTPKRLVLYTAPEWKRKMFQVAVDLAKAGPLNQGALMKKAMEDPAMKAYGKDAPKLAGDLMKSLGTLPKADLATRGLLLDEHAILTATREFFAAEFGAEVEVHAADAPGIPDPAGKAKHASPRRPAIYVE